MSKAIFCLICDRAPGYFEMTIQAIKCVRKHTKSVAIGVIFPPGSGDLTENTNAVLVSLKKLDPSLNLQNIFFKEGQNHFENWNPTQHKLDIQLFANEYDPIVWLDSDTVVLRDLSPYILSFIATDKKIAVLSDHVNNDEGFKKNWEGPLFIPQACYIIFRSAFIQPLFKLWEDTWREWITPYPFSTRRDPAPHFSNSFFCIEQYALGQSLFKFTQNFEKDVFVIDRSQLFIGRNVAVETHKIKLQFQQKSASRPSALAHIPKLNQVDVSPLIEKSGQAPPRSPMTVPIETSDTTTSSIGWGGSTPTSTTYAAEVGAEGGFLVTASYTTTPGVFEEGVEPITTSTAFSAAESDLTTAVRDTLSALNIRPTSGYAASSYVTSYGTLPFTSSYGSTSSYGAGASTSYGATGAGASSYGAVGASASSYGAAGASASSYGAAGSSASSYGAEGSSASSASSYGAAGASASSYGAAGAGASISSYGATGVSSGATGANASSYGATGAGATSYGAGGVSSYGVGGGGAGTGTGTGIGSGSTSYGLSTSYGAVTSYGGGAGGGGGGVSSLGLASSYASSYSYASSSGLSSAGIANIPPEGGISLTNYGELSLLFTQPTPGEGEKETSKTAMYVYGSTDTNANIFFLSTNQTLTSSAQAQSNLSNSNGDYYMIDLIQDNSIAHYYNANQGANSDFVVTHGPAVADTIQQIKTQQQKKGKAAAGAKPQQKKK